MAGTVMAPVEQFLPWGIALAALAFAGWLWRDRKRVVEQGRKNRRLASIGLRVGGIAHDFGNLLQAIMGNVTLAKMSPGIPAPAATRLAAIERAAWRARDIVRQLTNYARGVPASRGAVSLPKLLREAAEYAIANTAVKAEYECSPDLWEVNADPGELIQVFNNLAVNAVQAMPEGGRLRFQAVNEGLVGVRRLRPRWIKVTVADTGAGIAPEHLRRIFDPFFTTKSAGTGLGLATIAAFVKRQGGRIQVESELGRGTTFTLTLRAAAPAKPGSVSSTPRLETQAP